MSLKQFLLASAFLGCGTIIFDHGAATAATIDMATIDRSYTVATGTAAILPGISPGAISVISFGPTFVDTATSLTYSLSGTIDGVGGAFDLFNLGFPPDILLSGAVEDVAQETGLLQVLFRDTASASYFVFEATNALLPPSGLPTVPITAADASIYSATIPPIPLPASGLLLLGAVAAGAAFTKRRRLH